MPKFNNSEGFAELQFEKINTKVLSSASFNRHRYHASNFSHISFAQIVKMASILFTLLALSIEAADVAVVTSPLTPFDPSPLLPECSAVSCVLLFCEAYTSVEVPSESLVLDYSYDVRVSLQLPVNQTLVMWPWREPGRVSLRVYEETLAITQYLQAMNLSRVSVISDEEGRNLLEKFPEVYENVYYLAKDISQSSLQDFVKRIIKPSGHLFFAVLLGKQSTLQLLQELEAKKLNRPGFVYVLSKTACFYREKCTNCTGLMRTGVLCVTPEVSATARSALESEVSVFRAIISRYSSGVNSPRSLVSAIDTSPVLINIVNLVPIVVAKSPQEAESLTASFPGGARSVPGTQLIALPVSVNYMTYTPGSEVPTPGATLRGFAVAFDEKRSSKSILPNFGLQVNPVDLKSYYMNYTLVKENVARNKEKLGLMHFPIPTSNLIRGVYAAFRELNLSTPMSSSYTEVALTEPANYPLLLNVLCDSKYYALITARMIKYFGWRKLAVIYANGGDAEDVHIYFKEYAKSFGITFTNSESSQRLMENLANGITAELNATLTEIINSPARIIMINHPDTGYILEAMYDLGVRSEYLILCYLGPTKSSLNEGRPNIAKRVIVGQGAFIITPRPYIGAVGRRVYQEFLTQDGGDVFEYSCFFYDAVMLYFYATDYMVSQGLDYEDAYEVVKAMRGTHFAGCGGTVYIAANSNSKPEAEFAIRNFRYHEVNQSIELEDVLYYNPFSSVLIKDVAPIMWPDGSFNFWNDTLVFQCAFNDNESREFVPGYILGVLVSGGIMIWTIVWAVVTWRLWRFVYHPILIHRAELSWEDIAQMVGVPLEAIQITAIGPDYARLNQALKGVGSLASLEIAAFIGADGELFWRIMNLIFGIVGAYLLISLLRFSGIDEKLDCIPLASFMLLFVKLALPVVSNLVVIPVLSMLSLLFHCYNAAGDSFQDSYLSRDCNTFCWRDSHIFFTVASAISLIVFIPLITLTKPLWQEDSNLQHIKQQPNALVSKTLLQTFLVVTRNILHERYPNAHSSVFLSALLFHLVLLLRYPSYNYQRYFPIRANLWATVLIIAVLAFSVLTLVARILPWTSTVCFYTFIVLFCLCMIVGVGLQCFVERFKSLFFRKKFDHTNLFKFAFTFGSRAQSYFSAHFRSHTTQPQTRMYLEGVSTSQA